MDWILTIVAAVVLALLVAPLAMLVLTVFVLVPLAHLMPAPSMLSRARFRCPFSNTTVTTTFVTVAGEEHPTDVEACSRFGDGRVVCAKECLALTAVSQTPSAMVPRFSLVAGGTAPR